MTITTPLRTRLLRLFVAALTITVAIVLPSSSAGQDAAPAASTATPGWTAKNTYVPSPAFKASWNKAKAAAGRCDVKLAYKRYQPLRQRGFKLDDLVARMRFYAGISTAAYRAGQKSMAKKWAKQALVQWDELSEAEGSSLQQEGIHLADVKLGLLRNC